MNDFMSGIMDSIKQHTLVWLGGAAVSGLGLFYVARTHPMSPMAQTTDASGSDGSLSAAPRIHSPLKNAGKQNKGRHTVPPVQYYPPQPPPETIIPFPGPKGGASHMTFEAGDHNIYEGGLDNHTLMGPGRWLPATEDLRAN